MLSVPLDYLDHKFKWRVMRELKDDQPVFPPVRGTLTTGALLFGDFCGCE